ncbi:MAG: endolytic transglycosylase MltG, partial [Ignavibacteria bacterium]
GLTIRQMGRLLQRQIGIDSARFVEEAKNDSLIKLLGLEAENLEGYLFPDTYQFSFGGLNREREVIQVLAAAFRKKMTPDIRAKMDEKGIALTDLITMASIIEGETRYEPEKSIIAGVYYNRIKKGMKLEADPTVQYALPEPKKRLLYSDLKYPSPYNTYLIKGLPPGPINNPGLSSILAALNPEEHKYLYFVAKGDGSHRYAESYEEHKKNIILYQQFLKEQEEKKKNK